MSVLMAHANNPSCFFTERQSSAMLVRGFIHAGLIFGRGSTALRAHGCVVCSAHAHLGHAPQKMFENISALRGHLMASEACCMTNN